MAKSVFVGTAIANDKKTSAFTFMGPLRNLFRREGDFIHVATFRVETNIKNAASREIRITTGRFGGFKADIGESVLVYAFGDKELETSICWIRRLQGAREELKVLLNGAAQPAAAADR